jgi:hypothetical protein
MQEALDNNSHRQTPFSYPAHLANSTPTASEPIQCSQSSSASGIPKKPHGHQTVEVDLGAGPSVPPAQVAEPGVHAHNSSGTPELDKPAPDAILYYSIV